jgi:hypothetical protein
MLTTTVQQLAHPNSNSITELVINSPLTMCNACHMGCVSVNLPLRVLNRGKDKAPTDRMVQKGILII